jgi:hypothetical protein
MEGEIGSGGSPDAHSDVSSGGSVGNGVLTHQWTHIYVSFILYMLYL